MLLVSALVRLSNSLGPTALARLRAMSTATDAPFPDALPAPWLAARMAVDPAYIDAMRRGGELIAVRQPGSSEWCYPAWQFDHGKPRDGISRIVETARARGIGETKLYDLLTAPLGLRDSGRSLVDLLREGRVDEVVEAIRAAG
jgi:hypothetical protein